MEQSKFPEIVEKYFSGIIGQIEEKINGENPDTNYYFKKWLSPKYSMDLKWGSSYMNDRQVMADSVALDSPAPLKNRGTYGTVFGELPKQSLKYRLNERQIADVQIMQRMGKGEAQIVKAIFDDTKHVIYGHYDKAEFFFLELLSKGFTLVSEDFNTGTGVRVNAGYLDANKFTPTINWGQTGYKPISDLKRVRKNAKNIKPTYALMTDETYDLIRLSEEAKYMSANYLGLVIVDAGNLPTPTSDAFNAAFKAETKLTIVIVDKTVTSQKNNTDVSHDPFDGNAVVLTSTLDLGDFVYGDLPEASNKVSGVTYGMVDNFILLKKWGETDPLQEFTGAEGIYLPVISNVQNIYHLAINEASADDQTEADTQFSYDGITYVKTQVITELGLQGTTVASDISDAALQNTINQLSSAKKKSFKAAFPTVTPDTYNFTNAADAVGKTFVVSGALTGAVTATATGGFVTPTPTGLNVVVTVSKNESGSARTSDVTITQNSRSVIVVVTQELGS